MIALNLISVIRAYSNLHDKTQARQEVGELHFGWWRAPYSLAGAGGVGTDFTTIKYCKYN